MTRVDKDHQGRKRAND